MTTLLTSPRFALRRLATSARPTASSATTAIADRFCATTCTSATTAQDHHGRAAMYTTASAAAPQRAATVLLRNVGDAKLWTGGLHLPPKGSGSHRQALTFSSNADSSDGGGSYSPVEWWRGRQEKKEAEKYVKRIEDMSQKEKWTIGDMGDELDEVVQSWSAKMPVLSNNKEMQMAKKMHATIQGLVGVVGRDASDDILDNMTRTQKLQAAVAGETTVEEINLLVQQFQTMALMHRVLRKRVAQGKPLPTTQEAMQTVLQAEGRLALSKKQKSQMAQTQIRSMKKSMRRR